MVGPLAVIVLRLRFGVTLRAHSSRGFVRLVQLPLKLVNATP
jgi:hypothetical protein